MSAIPEPWRDLMREIGKIKEQLRRLSNRSPFFGTGVHPTADGGLASNAFDGDLDSDDAGTTGWAANDQKMAVGELILRPGSIGNDSLTNPVEPVAANDTGSGFAVTTVFTERAFAVLTVPAGFTQLSIIASGWVFAYNPNTSGGVDGTGTDALWCFVRVGGPSNTDSQTHGQGISGSGGFTTATAGIATVKTGLTPGSTVRLGVYAGSSIAGFAADAGNNATLSALLTWLR